MKIDKAGDLIYWTYYMIDWKKVVQEPSDRRCQQCGKPMQKVEAVTDAKGASYDGYVCHGDKVLVWVRSR
ncbi:MAG: hypothetical protein HY296_03850 [Thaumarchaeota archaeon]|nr:hypothetical protein [Nitrososphaerota archaeon]